MLGEPAPVPETPPPTPGSLGQTLPGQPDTALPEPIPGEGQGAELEMAIFKPRWAWLPGSRPPPATGGRRGSSGNTAPSEPRPGDAPLNWPGDPESAAVQGAVTRAAHPGRRSALPPREPDRPVSPLWGAGAGPPWVSDLSCQLTKLMRPGCSLNGSPAHPPPPQGMWHSQSPHLSQRETEPWGFLQVKAGGARAGA